MLDESKTEILINFFKFLLNFIHLKHLNYPHNFVFKFLLNFILLKHLKYP
jgi:hypothetical protein